MTEINSNQNIFYINSKKLLLYYWLSFTFVISPTIFFNSHLLNCNFIQATQKHGYLLHLTLPSN